MSGAILRHHMASSMAQGHGGECKKTEGGQESVVPQGESEQAEKHGQ